MKKRNLLLVMLAVLLVFGMVIGCGPGEETPPPEPGVNFTVTANGDELDITTTLTLKFDEDVTLLAGEITLSGVDDVEKGALTGSGDTWTLKIGGEGWEDSGTLTVKVEQTGKTAVTKTVPIFYADPLKKLFPSSYLGVYSYTYKWNDTKNVKETIRFTKNTFNIEDDYKTLNPATPDDKPDHLYFSIKSWEKDNSSNSLTEDQKTKYPIAVKFTGTITAQQGFVPSTFTVPKTSSETDVAFRTRVVKDDGTGPDFTMYLYIGKASDGKPTFIRSSFSENGSNKAIVATATPPATNTEIRAYLQTAK